MINNSARTRFAMTLSTLATALLLAAGCSSGAGGSALGAVPTPGAPESGATSPQTKPANGGTAQASSGRYPSSMVALGHSGNTGYNSDPDSPATTQDRTPGRLGTTRP